MKTPEKYTSLRVGLHWLMVLLLVGVYATMELRDFYPKGSDLREALKTWHFMLGLSVLVLVVLRLLARWMQPGPPELPGPAWQMWLAKALSGQIKGVHEVVATLGYFMIGLHALGALFHHYVLKDNTLRRMWL